VSLDCKRYGPVGIALLDVAKRGAITARPREHLCVLHSPCGHTWHDRAPSDRRSLRDDPDTKAHCVA